MLKPRLDIFGTTIGLVLLVSLSLNFFSGGYNQFETEKFHKAIQQCEGRFTKPYRLDPTQRNFNPRVKVHGLKAGVPKLIKNALLLDGDGTLSKQKMDIYIKNGIISNVHEAESIESAYFQQSFNIVEVIDAQGHIVSPGLVEMHSHAGICSQPELKGVNDMFELMSPVTPFTRVIDAFNIGDPAIQLIAKGGVTTSLVLPSANLISGEGYAFKMFVPPSSSAEDMLVQYHQEHLPNQGQRQRWMKMACGENPKKRYISRPEAPKSRMGLGYLFREYIHRAELLRDEQDEWCDNVARRHLPTNPFPYSVELEILVGLLRGQVQSNAHCYETFDIETLLRHAKEFGFQVDALHHALDAYKIPQILKNLPWNITVATFASLWGFKKEAFQASLFSPAILEKNDINVVLTTDHPALPGHTLNFQAQIAHNYGLSKEKAFSSITGQAAIGLGLDDRIGFLRKGYDADIVIWNKHPLEPGSTPLSVFIDGETIMSLNITKEFHEKKLGNRIKSNFTRNGESSDQFIITGIEKSFMKGIEKIDSDPYELLVADGHIKCFAKSCKNYTTNHYELISVENGALLPGLTALTESHGLVEMQSEQSTGDGDSRSIEGFEVLKAKDGLHLQSEHLKRAYNSGVLRIITPPFRSEGKKFITGVSTSFNSNAQDLSGILKQEVALHITLGDMGKEDMTPTISSQISTLRDLLYKNLFSENTFGEVARGVLPLAVHVNSKDVLLHLIKLKKELKLNVIVIGGLESHLVVDKLKAENIPVVLKGWACQRKFWDERRCLTGVGGEVSLLQNLTREGITVGLGYPEDLDVRLALDYCASAASFGGLSESEAVNLLSYNVDKIFNLKSENQSFIVLEGSPTNYDSNIAVIVENGVITRMYPELEPL